MDVNVRSDCVVLWRMAMPHEDGDDDDITMMVGVIYTST